MTTMSNYLNSIQRQLDSVNLELGTSVKRHKYRAELRN